MSVALEEEILERLHRLDEARLAEVLDFVEFLADRPLRTASPKPSDAYPIGGDAGADDMFFGFAPFPHRGGCVSEELVNRLRDEQHI